VQFTNPSDNTNFAYVGKRTTGTQAGDYLNGAANKIKRETMVLKSCLSLIYWQYGRGLRSRLD